MSSSALVTSAAKVVRTPVSFPRARRMSYLDDLFLTILPVCGVRDQQVSSACCSICVFVISGFEVRGQNSDYVGGVCQDLQSIAGRSALSCHPCKSKPQPSDCRLFTRDFGDEFRIIRSLYMHHTSFPSSISRQILDSVKSITMSATGTYRNTPKGKPQTGYSDSPSNIPIPRPKFEGSGPSEASTSQSASRAKQSKRDEVRSDPSYRNTERKIRN